MQVLLEEVNSNGNIQAIVEADERVVCLYLFHADDFEGPRVRTCWVRNLAPAPAELNVSDMREGRPPLLPTSCCAHPRGAPAPDASTLSVVWFEEGNGVALFENDELLAVIPPWSGHGGFHGYARDCTQESPLCWPMPKERALFERIEQARDYWRVWDDPNLWTAFQEPVVRKLEKQLGAPHAKYFAIDSGEWPPKAMLRFDLADRYVFATVGVALRAQPNVEMSTDDPARCRRIELAAALDASCPAGELSGFGQWISGLASYPWNQYTWLGPGHTIPCGAVPASLGGARFPFVILVAGTTPETSLLEAGFRNDPITYLWLLPITEQERDVAMNEGAEALLQRLGKIARDPVHRRR